MEQSAINIQQSAFGQQSLIIDADRGNYLP
jgi:hypothetical protein